MVPARQNITFAFGSILKCNPRSAPRLLDDKFIWAGLKSLFGKTGGLERYDWGTQDVSMGYFIRTLNYLINGFRTLGQSYIYMSKEEAHAIEP